MGFYPYLSKAGTHSEADSKPICVKSMEETRMWGAGWPHLSSPSNFSMIRYFAPIGAKRKCDNFSWNVVSFSDAHSKFGSSTERNFCENDLNYENLLSVPYFELHVPGVNRSYDVFFIFQFCDHIFNLIKIFCVVCFLPNIKLWSSFNLKSSYFDINSSTLPIQGKVFLVSTVPTINFKHEIILL